MSSDVEQMSYIKNFCICLYVKVYPTECSCKPIHWAEEPSLEEKSNHQYPKIEKIPVQKTMVELELELDCSHGNFQEPKLQCTKEEKGNLGSERGKGKESSLERAGCFDIQGQMCQCKVVVVVVVEDCIHLDLLKLPNSLRLQERGFRGKKIVMGMKQQLGKLSHHL
ncbi:hypothetical protein ACFXTH_009334 [Malus domestica]